MRAAQLHADQMAASQTLSHTLLRAPYPRLQDRMNAAGYHWRGMTENLAQGYPSTASVMTAWMNSPGHRANLVSTRLTETGVGVATGKDGHRYWVQVFATPQGTAAST